MQTATHYSQDHYNESCCNYDSETSYGETHSDLVEHFSKQQTITEQTIAERSITEQAIAAQISASLQNFVTHGLNDLKQAALMNRVDSKFILPIAQLPRVLKQLANSYSVLTINGQSIFNYQNQYYDTADFQFYRHHHNGKLNRYKVRHRHYVDTDTNYLEVKLKNNQKRTIKNRIKLNNQSELSELGADFIQQQMSGEQKPLSVCQHSGYQRIALANEAEAERLTLDFNLWYNNCDGNNLITLPHFFIAELKQAKKSKQSAFYQLMSQNQIFPSSFSKYCIGNALLYQKQIKTNRFKAILNRINQFTCSA